MKRRAHLLETTADIEAAICESEINEAEAVCWGLFAWGEGEGRKRRRRHGR
jgi:hypothetical protein